MAKEITPRHERVPNLLLSERRPEETQEEYRERQRANEKFLNEYLEGYPMDANATPSQRVLRRLFNGKRNLSSLKPQEKSRLRVSFGLTEDDLKTLVWFGTQTEIVDNAENYAP